MDSLVIATLIIIWVMPWVMALLESLDPETQRYYEMLEKEGDC